MTDDTRIDDLDDMYGMNQTGTVSGSFRDKIMKLTYVEYDIDIDSACKIYEAVHWMRMAFDILCGAVVH